MSNLRYIYAPVMVLIALGCGGGSSTSSDAGSDFQEAKEVPVDVSEEYPRTALGAFFQVDDVERWKLSWDENIPEEMRVGTLQSLENPNFIFMMQWSDDHDASRELVNSTEMTDIMEAGTIASDPQFRYYDIKYYDDTLLNDTFRLSVTIEVLNYEMWKSDFDKDEVNRTNAGLNTLGIATDADNRNLVYILFSTNDQVKAFEFLGDENTKKAIADSGVIGEPNMTWWKLLSN